MKNKVLFVVTILVVFLLGLLASSIINRKNEAKYKYVPQVDIGENEPRNEVWVKLPTRISILFTNLRYYI